MTEGLTSVDGIVHSQQSNDQLKTRSGAGRNILTTEGAMVTMKSSEFENSEVRQEAGSIIKISVVLQ
jgi:hypothetical protein